MFDAILYIDDFPALVEYIGEEYPQMLDMESGSPIITGISRSPAKVAGIEVLTYARLTEEELDMWDHVPHITPWGKTEFTGGGTADAVYGAVFADPELKAIYDRVYPHEPYEVEVDGATITVTPPERFGTMAGA